MSKDKNVEMFELASVNDTVAKFGGIKLLEEDCYTIPPVPIFGEASANPAVNRSYILQHPAVYLTAVTNFTIIGGAAFPIIQNKSIYHQYFSPDTWELWEQAAKVCLIKPELNLIAYGGLTSVQAHRCKAISLIGNGSYNYAHWMTEFLPQLVLLKKHGVDLSEYKIAIDTRVFSSMLEALTLLGINNDQLLKIDALSLHSFPNALWMSPVANVVFQRPNAVESSELEQIAVPQHAIFHSEALRATRDFFLDFSVQSNIEPIPEKIFIKRYTGRLYHGRSVINEAEIQRKLELEGFVSIDPSTLSFTEQIRMFSKAKFIVGASGAALLNMIWAPIGTKVIVLMNDAPIVNYWYFSNIASILGHQLSYVLGKTVNTGYWDDINHADFIIDCQCVCSALASAGLNTIQSDMFTPDVNLSVEELLNQAVLFQHDGLFEQATLAYKAILANMPNHAEANHNLGVIIANTVSAVDALPMMESAITNKPNSEQFWVTYIETLILSGALSQVVDALALGLNFGLTPARAEILGLKFFPKLDNAKMAQDKKQLLALVMHLTHVRLLSEKQQKTKVKVVFFVLHKSVWKLDSVFQAMLSDSLFDPVVLVCPYISHGEEEMLTELEATYRYFDEKGYPVISSYNSHDNLWVGLSELAPDLIFFTNPHPVTKHEYYEDAYMNYLSCYVPYDHQVSQYRDNQEQYNQYFHNAMWQIFVPHLESKAIFTQTSAANGRNVSVTGYPACEAYINTILPKKSVWKSQLKKKRKLIWAPHHTIDSPELPYSNFLQYAELFQQLAQHYVDDVQWTFKPHPMLKFKLYEYAGWGKQKTDQYYEFWESQSNTQLENGEYRDLFIESDAMIHDCGSFLAEYLYLRKPVLYLVASANIKEYFNAFGVKAFDACEHAYNKEDVINFIDTFLSISMVKVDAFYKSQIAPYFEGVQPSFKIISAIKQSFNH